MQERLRGNGVYIFDEPEAALSATGQLKMLSIMKDLVDKGSQFIIATHSPIILHFLMRKYMSLAMIIWKSGITQKQKTM